MFFYWQSNEKVDGFTMCILSDAYVKSIYDIRQTEIFDFFTTEVSNIELVESLFKECLDEYGSLCRNGKSQHHRNRRKSSIGIIYIYNNRMSEEQELSLRTFYNHIDPIILQDIFSLLSLIIFYSLE